MDQQVFEHGLYQRERYGLILSGVATPDWPKLHLYHMPGAFSHVPQRLVQRRNVSVRGT